MKHNSGFTVFQVATLLIIHMIAGGCKEDPPQQDIIVVNTQGVFNVSPFAGQGAGMVYYNGIYEISERGCCLSTHSTPTIADTKIVAGKGSGNFSVVLSGLTPYTVYYMRAFATTSQGATTYGDVVEFKTPDGFVDTRDGTVYTSVTIGNQVWMAENLRYLPSVSYSDSNSSTQPHYYVYDYEGTDTGEAKTSENYKQYGVLYNWPAAIAGGASSNANPSGIQGACPVGWHMPSDAEWVELTDYLGGVSVAGGKLKETGVGHWMSQHPTTTNESGFNARPGGQMKITGYGFLRYEGYWWTATEQNSFMTYMRWMSSTTGHVMEYQYSKEYGYSIRCVRN